MGKDLKIVPRFDDRWSYLYLEHGRLEKEQRSLAFYRKDGIVSLPIDQLAFVMLGPGTTLTHAAMKALAENNCLVCWGGEQGVRLYAHSTGGTHFSRRLLRQAMLFCDDKKRLQVIRRMYQKRFPEPLPENATIEQVRGMEGARMRRAYAEASRATGVPWQARSYDQGNWHSADPANRALSSANSCLYGLCHAAILSAGYSPAIGFIHTGRLLSFVYDIADLYKTELTIPLTFRTVAESPKDVERRVRIACRDLFHESKLMKRILPDIAEVLDARDDLGESPGELEGKIITLADRAEVGRVPWEPLGEGQGRTLVDGDP
ncbi:MAG: type I-E CRISPR-associated endonuclease Cas1 [Planctomycetes bacterium]|nr:type I-E CRISPR-associated endonuclease Cas1 [Planctomycetota bacterium]